MASDDDILRQAFEHFQKRQFDVSPGEDIPAEELEARRGRELNEKEVKVVGVYQPAAPVVAKGRSYSSATSGQWPSSSTSSAT